MSSSNESLERLTVGVEEEFLVIDASDGTLNPRGDELLKAAGSAMGPAVEDELNLCQIEVATPVCDDLSEVDHHLSTLRRQLHEAGEPLGIAPLAAATHPFSSWTRQDITPSPRYEELARTYRLLAREQVICGCHVHVGIHDPDLRIKVLNRIRPWLPVLLAMSANSPYWEGRDSGYASYRSAVWSRWPTAGMPPDLRDHADYLALLQTLRVAGDVPDASYLYWYVRPSSRYPTVEIRICDVCPTAEQTTLVAALCRALAWTCATGGASTSPQMHRRDVLDLATWRAARYGLSDTLVSPTDERPRPAAAVVDELRLAVRDGLEAHGDRSFVDDAIARLLADGTGAARQRQALARRGQWPDVIDALARGEGGERPHAGAMPSR